jgi:alkanesulfonate monooxygenase SsuD/methylene tetrahydromethanopterin reductase-like flavin-dependent oxidoreductase (luciferase family)
VEFGLQTRGTYEYVRTAARWAQANGLVSVALPDHYLAGRSPTGSGYDTRAADIYPYLGALAVETDLEICSLVSPVSYRHPAALLKLGLAVDELSGGRFTLGIGTGWMKSEHTTFGFPLPDWKERFDHMEEALGYLAAALGDGAGGFSGEHYQLEEIDHQPKGINLRIMVGGSGPRRTPQLAGRFADELNIYSLPVDDLKLRIERARASAAEAGRDPDALLFSSASPPIVGKDRDTYRHRLEAFAAARSVRVERLEEDFKTMAIPMGSHEEARDTFSRSAEAGITRYYLQILGSFDLDYAAELVEVLG